MPTYFEYKFDDGSTVLIEAEPPSGRVIKASRRGVDVVQTGKNFADAFASIRGSLNTLVKELDMLKVEEAEVKFGLKAVGEVGVFAVGKVGGEMNYEVTLKWKKTEAKSKTRSRK